MAEWVKLDIKTTLKNTLTKLKKERRKHNCMVNDPLTPGMQIAEWVIIEREEVLAIINEERVKNILTPLTEGQYLQFVALPALNRKGKKDYVEEVVKQALSAINIK